MSFFTSVPSLHSYSWGGKKKKDKQKQIVASLPNSTTIGWALGAVLGVRHVSPLTHCLCSPDPAPPHMGSVHAEATPSLQEDLLSPLFLLGVKKSRKCSFSLLPLMPNKWAQLTPSMQTLCLTSKSNRYTWSQYYLPCTDEETEVENLSSMHKSNHQ